ncbi:hypothetical protein [Paracoccus aerodenitrificans]|uniref:hypothetical protein n=1 Tax=Paracoccus aerodenitrificans TaxID=3017781 RepID=UPI0022F13674|nr:hypothetical protein [Paracoccus aerodenitrificans]WBU63272.1 hypothetical protein PAE61_13015 [Paracoccus aerodenitrificans]
MLRKLLLPLILIAVVAGGLFAGEMLRPGDGKSDAGAVGADEALPDKGASGHESDENDADAGEGRADEEEEQAEDSAYFRFPTQFFVPVMHRDRLDGVMVFTLTLEMPYDQQEAVFSQEYLLRDALLRSLMIYANTGGFDGNYTIEPRMQRLRRTLLDTAHKASGGIVTQVLIEDIARQAAA